MNGPGGLMGNAEGPFEVVKMVLLVTNIYLLYSVAFPLQCWAPEGRTKKQGVCRVLKECY